MTIPSSEQGQEREFLSLGEEVGEGEADCINPGDRQFFSSLSWQNSTIQCLILKMCFTLRSGTFSGIYALLICNIKFKSTGFKCPPIGSLLFGFLSLSAPGIC